MMNNESRKLKLKTRQSFVEWLSILTGFIGLIPFIYGIYQYGIQKENLNELGDFLGGTSGVIWAFTGALIVYLAFINQLNQNESQKEEILETKVQIERQNFTNLFLQLLNLHSNLLNDIDIISSSNIIKGKDCIRLFINEFKGSFLNQEGDYEGKINLAMKEVVNNYSLDISSYTNSLYSILQTLDISDLKINNTYTPLVIGQLSNYELAFIYYYSYYDIRFKEFVVKNNIFTKIKNDPSSEKLLIKNV